MQTPARRLKLVQSPTMEPFIPGLPDDVADQCLLRVAYDHLSLLDSVCRRWRHLLRSADFHARRRRAGITRSLLVLEVEELEDRFYYRTYATIFDSVSGSWRLLNRARALDLYSIIDLKITIGVGRSMVAIGWRGFPSVSIDGFHSKHCGEVRIYDFHTGNCRAVAPIPLQERIDVYYGAWNGASRVYIVYCDITKAGRVMYYDMEEDKWDVLTNAPAGRYTLAVGCYAGKFHRISGSGCGKLVIDSLDESSGEWSVEVVEGVNFGEPTILGHALGIRYAVGEDGNIYCCERRNIRVKYQGQDGWHELLDLPADVRYCEYLTSWKGGLLVVARVSQVVVCGYNPLNVYTLSTVKENDPTPPAWIAQTMPNPGLGPVVHCFRRFWLEI